MRMRRPVLHGSEVEMVHSGQFYILLLGKHISISWDQGTRLLVHISAQYRVIMDYTAIVFTTLCSSLIFLY